MIGKKKFIFKAKITWPSEKVQVSGSQSSRITGDKEIWNRVVRVTGSYFSLTQRKISEQIPISLFLYFLSDSDDSDMFQNAWVY